MGDPSVPKDVKLVAGFIFRDAEWLESARSELTNLFGRTDFESPVMGFTSTNYYEEELGPDLKRKFMSFERLLNPEDASGVKLAANRIEALLSAPHKKRRVNIDPGYLELSKLVLLTTKDYFHRIYLANGIYAEVTLFYKDKSFRPFAWTYPDYKTKECIDIFNGIRDIYKDELKKCSSSLKV